MPSDDMMRRLSVEIKNQLKDTEASIISIVQIAIDKSSDEEKDPALSQPSRLAEIARKIIELRRVRRKYFAAELFHERAWDMLLELFVASSDGREIWVKSLLGTADGSPTTAIRWLDYLESTNLIHRRSDEADRRRVIVTLSTNGEAVMSTYLQDVGSII